MKNRSRRAAAASAAAIAATVALGGAAYAGTFSRATADFYGASATAVDIAGLASVSTSDATYGHSHWTGLNVLGQEIIGKDSGTDGGSATWTGLLGGQGSWVDFANMLTCNNGTNTCAEVLPSDAQWYGAHGSIAHADAGNPMFGDSASVDLLNSNAWQVFGDGGSCGGADSSLASAEVSQGGANGLVAAISPSSYHSDVDPSEASAPFCG